MALEFKRGVEESRGMFGGYVQGPLPLLPLARQQALGASGMLGMMAPILQSHIKK